MPQLHLERSSIDPAIYYSRRLAPNGNWSRKISIRVHELRVVLQAELLTPEEVDAILSLAPGNAMTLDVK
jgi:hypothetical protein